MWYAHIMSKTLLDVVFETTYDHPITLCSETKFVMTREYPQVSHGVIGLSEVSYKLHGSFIAYNTQKSKHLKNSSHTKNNFINKQVEDF